MIVRVFVILNVIVLCVLVVFYGIIRKVFKNLFDNNDKRKRIGWNYIIFVLFRFVCKDIIWFFGLFFYNFKSFLYGMIIYFCFVFLFLFYEEG